MGVAMEVNDETWYDWGKLLYVFAMEEVGLLRNRVYGYYICDIGSYSIMPEAKDHVGDYASFAANKEINEGALCLYDHGFNMYGFEVDVWSK